MLTTIPSIEALQARLPWLKETFDVRSLLCARPNKKFVLCDLAQIEPRALAWLSGHERLLTAIRNGFGVYEAAAVATGKYSGVKGGFKKQKALYQAQKAQTLALGYGCGWRKYIAAAMTLASYDVCKHDVVNPETGLVIYGSAARKEVSDFRTDNKEIPDLWAKLDGSFRACVGSNFIMELPSGRVMTYRNVQRKRKKKAREIIDEKTGLVIETKVEERWAYTAEIDGRRYELYGGLLTENITQAVARDVFMEGALRVEKEIAPVLWTVYDEVICEVPLDFDPLVIEKAMSITPSWLPGCPIGAEAKEALHYLK